MGNAMISSRRAGELSGDRMDVGIEEPEAQALGTSREV
jgi:hypothetical protein